MKKTLMSLSAAAVIGAGTIAAPQPAHAIAEWVIPTIIAAGVGGVALGAASSPHGPYAYAPYGYAAPAGSVYVQSAADFAMPRDPRAARRRFVAPGARL